ncbi:MAG: PHP domain-containing protein [Thermodesulfobacteriota bacterium]
MDYDFHDTIDLHIHTSASDGTYSAEEILALARHLNLYAVSITDHDTVEGCEKALQSGIPHSIQFLTGVEISAAPPEGFHIPSSFHILGYDIDIKNQELTLSLQMLQEARKDRNPKILKKLSQIGISISMQEIVDQAAGGQLGRPHIAQVMVRKGISGSIDEAFDNYLGKGKPAYVDKFRIGCRNAIRIIKNAGGIAVLAHPFLLKLQDDVLRNLIIALKSMGLEGLEVYYPEHSPERIAYYTELASCYDLLMTGGTDFHGELKPEIQLGAGKGNLKIPRFLYETLVKKNENRPQFTAAKSGLQI